MRRPRLITARSPLCATNVDIEAPIDTAVARQGESSTSSYSPAFCAEPLLDGGSQSSLLSSSGTPCQQQSGSCWAQQAPQQRPTSAGARLGLPARWQLAAQAPHVLAQLRQRLGICRDLGRAPAGAARPIGIAGVLLLAEVAVAGPSIRIWNEQVLSVARVVLCICRLRCIC